MSSPSKHDPGLLGGQENPSAFYLVFQWLKQDKKCVIRTIVGPSSFYFVAPNNKVFYMFKFDFKGQQIFQLSGGQSTADVHDFHFKLGWQVNLNISSPTFFEDLERLLDE